jgi:hypothetical protein
MISTLKSFLIFAAPQADWCQITEPIHTIHPKAMPMVLKTREEIDVWINAPAADVLKLQRPVADNTLKIVAKGTKKTGEASRLDAHSQCDLPPPETKRHLLARTKHVHIAHQATLRIGFAPAQKE